ncbi:serine hydrolase [uncultured Litoreibacter sp.]|uniref:serine hydrolase domain-containing protein n=1 Tax=uncultured Litoreibacter sp. TaxID=1392394 RepID=UPI0026352C43|nr:serine hydrolase [uncultured Litoreibacter sp.]
MRSFLKWALRVVLVLAAIAIVAGIWKREQIMRLMAVNSLFTEEKIVNNFSNMNSAFLWAEMDRGDAPVTPLPKGEPATLPAETAQWIEERNVTALVVLKDGQIVSENYYLGTKPEDRRISWSVAKSFLSALFGIAEAEGKIPDMDALVTNYVPQLKDTGYADATIKNVLQMSSGVTFDEDYLDYDSDINRMGRVLALGGTMDDFAAAIKDKDRPAGEAMEYTSIDTHVLGMVLRAATGRSVVELMEEKLIQPMGLEASPYYLTDGVGVAFVLGGLNLTTRDYARMGLMFLQDGALGGTQIVPADWVRQSTAPSAKTAPGKIGYGYQWWIPTGSVEGEFQAQGIYGQYVYINREAGIVIAVNSADRKFREAGVSDGNIAMFRAITQELSQ